MKHISSKLILLTITLTTALLMVTAYFSFSVLKKESRAYTFQGLLLQSQLLSEKIRGEFNRIDDVASELVQLHTDPAKLSGALQEFFEKTKNVMPELLGVGVILIDPENKPENQWTEFPASSISQEQTTAPAITEKTLLPLKSGGSEFIVLFPAKTAVLAIRVDFKKVLNSCSGMNVAFLDTKGQSLYHCNPEFRSTFDRSKTIIDEVYKINLESGTLERSTGQDSYLWSYSQAGNLGRIVSASTVATAYRPAYALASRVVVLILIAIGAAIVASIFVARRVTGPIEEVTLATQKIAGGDFDTRIDIKTKDETRTLANSVESMAVKIKKLLESEIEKTKLDAQLEVAGAVQRTLIPGKRLQFDQLKIDSYYRPADQCGGDWWGYVSSGNKLAVMIGDVSGHGYASALLVATTRGFLSMLQERIDREGGILMQPEAILKSLNGVVFDATKAELNMTAMCMILDLTTGKYEISSAGHNAAYQIASQSAVNTIRAEGPRLGEHEEVSSKIECIAGELEKGDRIILYTDGIQDLGPVDQPLGRKGFKKFLTDRVTFTSEQLVASMENELYASNEGRPLQDDLTFVVLERAQ